MKKKGLLMVLLMLVAVTAWAKGKTVVWENPTTEYGNAYGDGYFRTALDVTRVEMTDDETVVYITALRRSDHPQYNWFMFAADTYLKVGEQRYTVVSADNAKLGEKLYTQDGKLDMAFHFPPLPRDTKSFDFIEGDGYGAFQIKGIKPVEERWKQLFPSYWRDDQTGNWELALLEDCAVYQCRFWNYKQCDVNDRTGEAEIVMRSDNDELKVKVGKDKNGKRMIQIGDKKVTYSMITTRFMPDYPVKDLRTDFTDTHYKNDTITVIGLVKDMPEDVKKHMLSFNFGYMDFLTGDSKKVHADIDEQGRFKVKIPVINSTEFFCDWKTCYVRTMLEAGKTYFMLYDFKEGRRYFMGDDVRLQNELFRFPLDWNSVSMKEGEDYVHYIASCDSLIKSRYAYVDSLCQQHPTLSARFSIYRKDNTLWQQANDFCKSRRYSPEYNSYGQKVLTLEARKYAYDTFWTKICKPYTLHRETGYFLNSYLYGESYVRGFNFTPWDIRDHISECASNDEELALLTRWKKWFSEALARIAAAPTDEEKQKIADEENARNADMIKAVKEIQQSPKVVRLMSGQILIDKIKNGTLMLDSLGADQTIRDLHLTQKALGEIENSRISMSPDVLKTLGTMIGNADFMEKVKEESDRYLAIENREFDRLVLKSAVGLKDMTEGEALLKKILEPYKGKFVLLDIWGTWCGPCKEALSHSTEEYARLKDYDIVFLYLANRSPQESWENVIKEYNVTGDNVAHYNLPEVQQSAIERYLDVHAFPTYKLFNRKGELLNVDVSARQLDSLVRLLDSLK
ncbi:MAG: TlpA family protein disulfide reductase [Prevotella sp.]|nr:TlpA family protein disulfide reductase [Prevotella sp.]